MIYIVRLTSAGAVLCGAAHLQLLQELLLQHGCLLLLAHRAGKPRGRLCGGHLGNAGSLCARWL